MLRQIKTQTVAYYFLGLFAMASIIHFVEKDLLGLEPAYDLTSAIITVFIGGVLLVLPAIVRSDFQPLLNRNGSSDPEEKVPDIKTLSISFGVMMAVALILSYSGIMPHFDLESALYALLMGSLVVILPALIRRYSERSGKPEPSSSGMGIDHATDS